MGKKITLIIFILLSIILVYCWFFISLPDVSAPDASVVYDINDRVINGLTQQNRINVTLDEISPYFTQAIIATEDKNFYHNHGIDLAGILRALWTDIKARKFIAGGSTITQQTAKNLYLGNERTVIRKLKELAYTFQLERKYSKEEILTMYCNTIYFGEGAYGVEVAARTYFAKSANSLTLAEAALLAGLPQSPSDYDPYVHPQAAKDRQSIVLERMVEEKIISVNEKNNALAQPLVYHRSQYISGDAPYFIAMVKDYLIKRYGEKMVYQGGLRVFTTLDLDMQKAANQAYIQGMKGRNPSLQAALVAMDVSNGQIRALIGGRNFSASSYNRALSYRQPGSTFKPFMYSLAIDSGLTSANQFMDQEVHYTLPNGDVYSPTDYGNEPYLGKQFTLKEAVMISDNIVAVEVNNQLGPKNTSRHVEKFGFKNIQPVLSLPLGSNDVRPIDMAAGYSVFANRGMYNAPIYVLKVTDRNGNILEENQSREKRVISVENAYIITNMLQGVMGPGGTGSNLKAVVARDVAGKTGTTDNFNDAWFVGYTPQLCCAVWVGYDKAKPTNLYGGTVAGPIWANFINSASEKLPEESFIKPDDIDLVNICLDSGQVATDSCPRTSIMAFIAGTEPTDICPIHTSPTFSNKQEQNLVEVFSRVFSKVFHW
jgi:1A family penicillin-binding protein